MSENMNNKPNGEVVYYDVAAGVSRTAKAQTLSKRYSTKETVNLCIRERKGLSYELFFLILAGILLVLLLLEFFCVYRPYLHMEETEKSLAEKEAQVQRLKDSMKDSDTVKENYRKYNYEKFPRELVDREDVFQLIEEVVFPRGIITSFRLNGNELTMQISGVSIEIDEDGNDREYILNAIRASKIVEAYNSPDREVRYDDVGRASFRMDITFKNAA